MVGPFVYDAAAVTEFASVNVAARRDLESFLTRRFRTTELTAELAAAGFRGSSFDVVGLVDVCNDSDGRTGLGWLVLRRHARS